ncbi:GNAT family N-acetyltransferase [Paenibacillus kyungheensis]|uniref:GNAT family N-acetyltransferase n=1 Tax=Paenibacillus kyungheensis TaxID=1452732 RepID=A0AAX3LYM0_9BACL|nr:GNAT family N-acetyltransferase [Paenibacillus kyungheensis]WCT54986.1 GNAT family N-acetyltransferase [Paenibacillus kyungheensis]
MNILWKKIEQSSLQTWPALQSQLLNGWNIRLSDGYSKRSNSVSPLDYVETKMTLEEQIAYCEAQYHQAQLPVVFKMTSFVEPTILDQLLHARNYQIQDETSVQLKSLNMIDQEYANYKSTQQQRLSEVTYTIEEQWSEAWIRQASTLGQWPDNVGQSIAKLMKVNPSLPKAYITLYQAGTPVACAIGIIDGDYMGIYDVITGAAYRRLGFARTMLYHLMKWAKDKGASYTYLHVGEHNEVAIQLYRHLGFEEIYRYWYRVLLEK